MALLTSCVLWSWVFWGAWHTVCLVTSVQMGFKWSFILCLLKANSHFWKLWEQNFCVNKPEWLLSIYCCDLKHSRFVYSLNGQKPTLSELNLPSLHVLSMALPTSCVLWSWVFWDAWHTVCLITSAQMGFKWSFILCLLKIEQLQRMQNLHVFCQIKKVV